MKKILAMICMLAFVFSLSACCSLKEVRKLESDMQQALGKCEAAAGKAEDAAMRAEKAASKAEEMANKAEAMAEKCEAIFQKRLKK